MDPLACWNRLVEAVRDGDPTEAEMAARDLDGWRRSGGFRPAEVPESVWRDGVLLGFATVCFAVA